LPSKETASLNKDVNKDAYESLRAKIDNTKNTVNTPDTASQTAHAIDMISAKIRYLEKMQESIENKLDTQDDGQTSAGISSMTNAKHFTIRVNMMVLEYRRYAMMAQANTEPQKVLTLVGK
jgi:hypothetical protein